MFQGADDLLAYIPFTRPVPDRRVVMAWRKSFPRREAMLALIKAVQACNLPGVIYLDEHPPVISLPA